MSRKITFSVTVEFSDKITDDNEVNELAENIARAIKQEADNGMGIAPDDSEGITKSVSVSSNIYGVDVYEKIW